MKSGRAFSLLTGIALLGSIARFNALHAENRGGGAGPSPQMAARAADAEPAAPAGNPLWALPLKQLSITRDRPIFSPSRRPPPPPRPTYVAPVAIQQPAKPPEPKRPAVSLLGTVIGTTPDDWIGVFLETGTQNIIRLRVGEDHQGWVLRLAKTREVTLVKDGEQAVVLELPPPGETPALGGPTAPAAIPGLPIVSRAVSADEQPVRAARGGRRQGL